jgi:hypothetical protein
MDTITIPNALRVTGSVSLYRRFGKPTNLTQETVWLIFDEVMGNASVTLNETALGVLTGAGEFDITELLQERNALEATFDAANEMDGITGEVRLEIRGS